MKTWSKQKQIRERANLIYSVNYEQFIMQFKMDSPETRRLTRQVKNLCMWVADLEFKLEDCKKASRGSQKEQVKK